MMLLGGGPVGEENIINFCKEATSRSVVGYLSTVITNGGGAQLPDPYKFVVNVSDYNTNAPQNIFLLCGDGNLEPMVPAINEAASAKALTPTAQPWKWIQEIIKNFIEDITESNDEWLVFIDTNPSFSIYTQIAVSGAERLLVPINADDSSKTAASAMVANEQGIIVPKIHMLIGNRLTQFKGSAAAFKALSDATSTSLYEIYKKNPDYFVDSKVTISSKENFIEYYSKPLRDFNSAGVVCAHLGRLLSSMKQKYYTVYSEEAKVNAEKIKECTKAIDEIIINL